MSDAREVWDVIIIGAGPAGVSAALVLGRCRRRVLLCDRGTPRNSPSHAMHGFVSRDGIDPAAFRETVLQELARYPGVHFRPEEATSAARLANDRFSVTFAEGGEERARKLLLATGVTDVLPPVEGARELFGTAVFPCPYCDGWEFRDAPIAVYGQGTRAFEMARAMTAWSRDLIVFTNGRAQFSGSQRAALEQNAVGIETARIAELCGRDGRLESVRLVDGRTIPRRALFFDMPCESQSSLARSLGCELTAKGKVVCGRYEASTVPGVFAAGNILEDVQLAIVAAAEGARAAFGINRALTREDFSYRAGGPIPFDHPGPGTAESSA
ncbi:MAG TPA: NAD(P)/FAD-dependent oxidoreductase [Steroidobacteraceae bacterium]|nr:NAD(P)/FAD-dependent oxidoreductase [Steroidobacteraceae bacterium]